MKWNEVLAIAVAVVIAVWFVIYPFLSFMGAAVGVVEDASPAFSAYQDGSGDIQPFLEDVEKYNIHQQGSIYYTGPDDNDGVNDYKTRSIVSTPTLLLGEMIEPEKTLYVAVGIEKSYTPEEINAIETFLARGGSAIIADDFGNANQLSKDFGVTFYGGQFYDENFDKNSNFTIVKAHMGSDLYDSYGAEGPDGVWDDDQDGDGKIDEDDNTGASRNLDDDRDNNELQKDLRNNDVWQDSTPDEENEGIDEDPIDDDVLFGKGDAEDYWEGHENIDLEWLDGKSNDDDNRDGVIDKNDRIDEDLQEYQIITYKATGLSSAVSPWIWAAGSSKSFIDMDNNHELSIPQGDLGGKNADEVSSTGNEIQICVEIPVADDGTGAVDIVTGESMETIKDSDGAAKKYKVKEHQEDDRGKLITELGSITFVSDPSIFMKDLYQLNHISYDVNLPFDPIGNGLDDDGDGLIDEDREIEYDQATGQLLKDTPDTWSEKEAADYSWITDDMVGRPKYDYDNQQFLLDLIRHLCPAEEGETNLILIDESRHVEPSHLLKPIYRAMEVTGFVTSSPYYAYPMILSIGFILIFAALMVRDKESWVHHFDISTLYPRKAVPTSGGIQTTKLRLALKEKIRLIRGLSPEEFASLNEKTIITSVKDPELVELLQNKDRSYSGQEIQRMMEKIKKIQSI